jgi:hypothetical protein
MLPADTHQLLVLLLREILQDGSWDEISGEAFLRKLLSMPIEEAKYNTVSSSSSGWYFERRAVTLRHIGWHAPHRVNAGGCGSSVRSRSSRACSPRRAAIVMFEAEAAAMGAAAVSEAESAARVHRSQVKFCPPGM